MDDIASFCWTPGPWVPRMHGVNPDTMSPPAPPLAPPARPPRRALAPLPALERLLGIVFCAIVLLNFLGAAMRYLGGRAFVGADELQVYTMVWLLFTGAALAAVRKAHLRMDLLAQRLGTGAAWWRDLAESGLALAVCSLMVWVSGAFAAEMFGMEQRSDGAGIPMWLVHGAAVLGFLALALVALADLARLLLRRPGRGSS